MKRIISIVLLVLIISAVFTALPLSASAAETDDSSVGDFGGTTGACEWVFYTPPINLLIISGEGRMTDYVSDNQPWLEFSNLIKKAVFGSGVKNVGEYAFFHMNSVKSVGIGDTVETIGYAAFEGCDFSKVELPESLTEIDSRAFNNMPNLTSVTVPRSVTYIGPKAFGYNNDEKIEGFTIYGYTGSKAQSYANLYGFNFVEIGAYSGTTGDCEWKFNPSTGLMTISGSGAMADYSYSNDTKTTDAPWWDYRDEITSVVIGDSVTAIGDNAFFKCSNLTSLSLGKIVKTIGDSAFCYCDLEELTTINVETIGDSAFSHNENLSKVTMSGMVKTIDNYAFYYTAIADITLSENLEYVGARAFQLTDLTSVTIPEKVTDIGYHAFGYEVAETPVEDFTIYGYSGTAAETYADNNGFTFVDLSESPDLSGTTGDCTWEFDPETGVLTVSGEGAMADYEWDNTNYCPTTPWADFRGDITSLVIGDGVTHIGDEAFDNCSELTALTIGENVQSIGEYAFCDCSALTEVIIPDSVEEIGGGAFYNNDDLTKVTFGKNVKTIVDGAFEYCDLREVVIPDSVETIAYCAFYSNPNLTKLTLGEGVTSVDDYAFENCDLTEVTIPATVTEIGNCAFGYYDDGDNDIPIEGFTIKGYSGTAAETYADENGFTFVPLDSPVSDSVFVITGSSNWLNSWSHAIDEYVMTKNGDGTYEITIPDVPATKTNENYAVKVVEYVGGDEHDQKWHGMDGTSLNYEFRVLSRGDVTVTYDPASGEITATGPTVADPAYDIEFITAVGNGSGNWLNGASWEPDNRSNRMTEVRDGVYMIYYKDVPTDLFEYSFKFAANGGWDINWGYDLSEVTFGTPMPAAYDGNNIIFYSDDLPKTDDTVDITLILDLTKMDWSKKTGAKFTVTLGSGSGGGLTVTSASNFYGTKSVVYQDNIPSQVIIDYYCATDAYRSVNGYWALSYDPDVLQLSDASNKQNRKYTIIPIAITGSAIVVNNIPETGNAYFNFSNIECVPLCEEDGEPIPMVHLVFDVVGTGNTVVELETKQLVFMESGQAFDPDSATVFNSESDDGGKAIRDQLINDGAEIYTVIQPDGSSPSVLIGDVNGDNTVDILDATMIQKYTVDKIDLTDEQKIAADVNNDGVVDILDATLIQKYAVDKISEFPKKA